MSVSMKVRSDTLIEIYILKIPAEGISSLVRVGKVKHQNPTEVHVGKEKCGQVFLTLW